MSRWRGLLWWLAALPSLPLAVPLAILARRTALRLAPAAGPRRGVVGADLPGEPLRLLLLGESTVVGVGAGCLQHALVGCLAQALAARHGRPVLWRACGENGIRVTQACERLLPQVLDDHVDLALLLFGVNDTTGFTSMRRWQSSLTRVTDELAAGGARVAFCGVPPLQHFTALPWLLRRLLGARAALLDARLRQVAERSGAGYYPLRLRFSAAYLALDGFHPSSLGYSVWAQSLAAELSLSPIPVPALAAL
ncbi:lysophospholipase L1-like esterase [Pseudomonas sp. SJZ079]|uniref:SGNH/GDSL hydrolase family protein n=1 Tax=Pseudomonas sp. SJZ079 TaxID=2572887 RepID=UPI00119B67E5|nr:SGNH/GDSL hydrolase family protein [Pseudomonas sp. SJZ079]TWC29635.1 lysophospholipase L1-like esterase [Pseudomonas sp. SJZ079]